MMMVYANDTENYDNGHAPSRIDFAQYLLKRSLVGSLLLYLHLLWCQTGNNLCIIEGACIKA